MVNYSWKYMTGTFFLPWRENLLNSGDMSVTIRLVKNILAQCLIRSTYVLRSYFHIDYLSELISDLVDKNHTLDFIIEIGYIWLYYAVGRPIYCTCWVYSKCVMYEVGYWKQTLICMQFCTDCSYQRKTYIHTLHVHLRTSHFVFSIIIFIKGCNILKKMYIFCA